VVTHLGRRFYHAVRQTLDWRSALQEAEDVALVSVGGAVRPPPLKVEDRAAVLAAVLLLEVTRRWLGLASACSTQCRSVGWTQASKCMQVQIILPCTEAAARQCSMLDRGESEHGVPEPLLDGLGGGGDILTTFSGSTLAWLAYTWVLRLAIGGDTWGSRQAAGWDTWGSRLAAGWDAWRGSRLAAG
jgi:hypothetical protein